jgi:superfamily II DNA or RNA helicase
MRFSLKVAPRAWQVEALEIWRHYLRGVVSVVTGGGKTVFAYLCIREFLRLYPNGRLVIVVPTSALLDQWYVGLQEDFGATEDVISVFSGIEKSKFTNLINLIVINTARDFAFTLSEIAPAMLIVDECHRAGSSINSNALRGTYAATLGLSATPKRQYDDGFETLVSPVLGDVIYEYTYVEASRDGIIVPFKLVNVQIQLMEEEKAEYDKLSKRAAVLSARAKKDPSLESKLIQVLQQRSGVSAKAVMRIPASARIVDDHRGQRTLIFHERKDPANKIALLLEARNHSVAIYHTGIGPHLRRDNLKLFRRGLTDVLVSCRALDEGLNVPETSIAIIAASTASERQRIQRLGRVLRPSKGKAEAIIYTLYATHAEHVRLEREQAELTNVTTIQWLELNR